jgi:uncharacterized membrane protein YphA (DoxX/SURF4 family)
MQDDLEVESFGNVDAFTK